MITFDGHRSMLRRPFAEKKLAQIRAIDVPSKAVRWDGFLFKVWQQDELSGGHITAPMGAVVILSTWDGMFIATADYWKGAWSGARQMHTIKKDDLSPHASSVYFFIGTAAVDPEMYEGMVTSPVVPSPTIFKYGYYDDLPWAPGSAGAGADAAGRPSVPGIMPHGTGEMVRLTINDVLLQPGDETRAVFETKLSMYNDAGLQVSRRMAIASQSVTLTLEVDKALAEHVNWFGPNRAIIHGLVHNLTSGGSVFYDLSFAEEGIEISSFQREWLLPQVLATSGTMPAAVRSALLNAPVTDDYGVLHPWMILHSLYTFLDGAGELVALAVIQATVYEGPAKDWFDDYFEDHPGDEKWRLLYVLRIGNGIWAVDSSQFIGLLDAYAPLKDVVYEVGGVTHISWTQAYYVAPRFCRPWPLESDIVPYDSALFHDTAGNTISWSRRFGAVAFTPSGLHQVSDQVWLPTEVIAEVGVRPEISLAGMDGDGANQFVCVCRKVDEGRIRRIYVGTPFEENKWIPVPGPPAGFTLVHVRPVRAKSLADAEFIGVAYGQKEGADSPGYYFASIHVQWDDNPLTYDDLPPWSIHGRLPFGVTPEAVFQVGLFGKDKRVMDMATFPDHPPTSGQSPVSPDYSLYARGLREV